MDQLQIFVNEYISPSDTVLVISETFIQEIKQMLDFTNSEYYISNDTFLPGVDITYNSSLPFMDNTFDSIICLKEIENDELDRVLRNGKIFKKIDN